ncbi:hypothetical protein ABTE84_20170, partial [Acinetobacter baumannii]
GPPLMVDSADLPDYVRIAFRNLCACSGHDFSDATKGQLRGVIVDAQLSHSGATRRTDMDINYAGLCSDFVDEASNTDVVCIFNIWE